MAWTTQHVPGSAKHKVKHFIGSTRTPKELNSELHVRFRTETRDIVGYVLSAPAGVLARQSGLSRVYLLTWAVQRTPERSTQEGSWDHGEALRSTFPCSLGSLPNKAVRTDFKRHFSVCLERNPEQIAKDLPVHSWCWEEETAQQEDCR